jgi:ABC-type multidrug transport system permease subunit
VAVLRARVAELYPAKIMPGWLQVISKINPLTYEVEVLRGLLIGTETTLWLDVVVLVGATVVAITCAALLLPVWPTAKSCPTLAPRVKPCIWAVSLS